VCGWWMFCVDGSSGFLCFLLLSVGGDSGGGNGSGDCIGDDVGGGNSRVDPGKADGRTACIGKKLGL